MRELQDKVRNFVEYYDIKSSPEINMLDLLSELGEVSKEILKSSNYGKENIKFTESFGEELGDVLFVLIKLANNANIDLKSELLKVLDKYEKRFKEKGSIGSGK